jgi:brefeldin A-inhibited guanine nucleotide-exchange protein
MAADEGRRDAWQVTHARLVSVCNEALGYFLSLTSESHREAWTCLLLLMLTRIFKMPDDKVSFYFIHTYV